MSFDTPTNGRAQVTRARTMNEHLDEVFAFFGDRMRVDALEYRPPTISGLVGYVDRGVFYPSGRALGTPALHVTIEAERKAGIDADAYVNAFGAACRRVCAEAEARFPYLQITAEHSIPKIGYYANDDSDKLLFRTREDIRNAPYGIRFVLRKPL